MVEFEHGFSGFSVTDVEEAKRFYGGTLGLPVELNDMGILTITLPGGTDVIAYPKDDHVPAVFTVLNLVVDDISSAVDALAAEGVSMERYEGMPQDDAGIMRGRSVGRGPDIAWFTDPSGNVIALMQN